ncbi:hypothetical protein [Halomonas korlensis]|nr:hypothetical protein [Halomonas korlensis]
MTAFTVNNSDKDYGGKADVLKAGIHAARRGLFCAMKRSGQWGN